MLDLLKNSNCLDYLKRAYDLIGCATHFPKADKILHSKLESSIYIEGVKFKSFTYNGFDIPKATHPLHKHHNEKEGYEVWSKDIYKENRLIYQVYDGTREIMFIKISGYDLDANQISTKLQSELDCN